MRKKDIKKITEDLEQLIKVELLNNFKNRKGYVVDSVEFVNIMNFETDDENEDRDKIIVTIVYAESRVWVKFVEDSKSSDNITLRNNKPIEFIYKNETDEFEISTKDVIFFINSPY